jgi:CRP/FNR family cyclic AMP-dependent transcriptional regulator
LPRSTPKTEGSPLAVNGWLSLCPAYFQDAILQRVAARKFERGEAIYRIGDPPGGLWAIVDGAVQIEIPGPAAAPELAHFATPGYWFGEGPLIHSAPRRVGVVAATPSTLATISLSDCNAVLAEEPANWRWIALLATMNTDLAIGVAADLLLQGPRERVIAALLRLGGFRNGLFLPSSPKTISLSQERLGQITNLSRTLVSGIVRNLEEQGLIKIEYRGIRILDDVKLKSLLLDAGLQAEAR